jgi:5-methylcytosine-specific restriction enzyme subunit McrC
MSRREKKVIRRIRSTMNFKVPIKSIYYMLCYSWNLLDMFDKTFTDEAGKIDEFYAFLSRILINSLNPLIKRDFERDYIEKNDELNTVKGKIDLSTTFKTMSLKTKGKIYCDYEDYKSNILQNQIIKTTIYNLLKSQVLEKELKYSSKKEMIKLKNQLHKVYFHFGNVDLIKLNSKIFNNIVFHRNNKIYKIIIRICELIYNNLLINENEDGNLLQAFQDDDKKMAKLFEDFVRKFYQKHKPELKPRIEYIKWNFDGKNKELIPKMITDISLTDENNKIKYIIDTKYYKDAVKENYGNYKFISNNLYQLFAYLNNYQNRDKYKMKGILLYPENGRELDDSYKYKDMDIEIKTINLNQDHEDIKKRLENILYDTNLKRSNINFY